MKNVTTITGKRQITIPVTIFRKAGLSNKQKLLVAEVGGRIIISPAKKLIDELAGSLKMPRKWKSKNLDLIIKESKKDYFKNK